MLEIMTEKEEATTVFKLKGFLDTTSSPELQTKIEALSKECGGKRGFFIAFDMKEVEFVSSAGLRVILLAKKLTDRQDGSMEVRNVKQAILDVFGMTGFSTILKIK